MENASKALIIAGAILISILLISVGVLIMNSTQNATSGVGKKADAMEIEQFNSTFTIYAGTEVSAAQAKALINAVKSSNAANQVQSGDPKYVTIDTNGIHNINSLNANKHYTVVVNVSDTTGYVDSVTITENQSNPRT